jgi:hypothetical protein
MATFVMFTTAGTAQAAVVINIEHITHVLQWNDMYSSAIQTRIHMSDGEYIYVTEDFNRVIDKIRSK